VSSSTFNLRQFLDRFSGDVKTIFAEMREESRCELASELNLAVRRLRQSGTLDELIATLADTAGGFAEGAAVFRISDGVAKSEKLDLAIPLGSAAALAGAVESRDQVTAVTTSGEVS
jgi:hypothetical protein